MRHVHRPVACLALSAVVACGGSGGTDPGTKPPGDVPEVFTPGNVFSPFSLTIAVGDSVRFNISGASHNAIFKRSTAGAPADVPIVTNTVVVRRFTTRGTFAYDCTVHPGMSGEIVVK